MEQLEACIGSDVSPLCGRYDGKVVLVRGDLEVFGSIDLDQGIGLPGWSAADDGWLAGLWVTGDLKVQGAIANPCGDYGRFLVVEGETEAEHVIGGGAEIYLLGGARVSALVIGHYNHGTLQIRGHLHARVIVNDDHDLSIPRSSTGLRVDDDSYDSSSFGSADFADFPTRLWTIRRSPPST